MIRSLTRLEARNRLRMLPALLAIAAASPRVPGPGRHDPASRRL
jgi:hypothetical protein